MEPFKNKYNPKSLKTFSNILKDKSFNQKKFIKVVDPKLKNLEMKARVDLISHALNECLDLSYEDSIDLLLSRLDEVKEMDSFWIWPLTNFVALFGLDSYEKSAQAIGEMTKKFTSEFVIRYFIKEFEAKFYKDYIIPWSKDNNEHLRRLASEGTRPNLPWGMKVNYINENLKKNIKILNRLKNDDSLYVRKSVANHFNDITRLDPDLVIETLSQWNRQNEKQAWIIKHALRTMLKDGDERALKLNGFDINPKLTISHKTISKKRIKEGDSFEIKFVLNSKIKKKQKLSIDYIIHYPKKNGKLSAKSFKMKDILLEGKLLLSKKVSFRKVTTRKHYPGVHKIEIKISNKKYFLGEFNLKS